MFRYRSSPSRHPEILEVPIFPPILVDKHKIEHASPWIFCQSSGWAIHRRIGAV
jgi:hypothetical protein